MPLPTFVRTAWDKLLSFVNKIPLWFTACFSVFLIGIVIWLQTYKFDPLAVAVPYVVGTATLEHSTRYGKSDPTKTKGDPQHMKAWFYETWQFKHPNEMYVGQGGTLTVTCLVEECLLERDTPEALEKDVDNARTTKPTLIREPVEVRAEGSFAWSSEPALSSEKDAANPLEFKWVFAAKDAGKQVVQIILPKRKDIKVVRKIVFPTGGYQIRNSRYVEFSISVANPPGPFNIPYDWWTIIAGVLGWLATAGVVLFLLQLATTVWGRKKDTSGGGAPPSAGS